VGQLVEILAPLHTRTRRDYMGRMMDEKVRCSLVAREYGEAYWDGDRRYGYGGYRYDGRWTAVAQRLIEWYDLAEDARILDVGCGKGHLLYELSRLLPRAEVTGFDLSGYAIDHSKEEIRDRLFVGNAEDPFAFADKQFDLVFSLMTLHNLPLPGLARAVAEIERTGQRQFIAVESYRTVEELFNLECWALTCETFFRPEEWVWLFDQVGCGCDYEFLYFE
jgi:SAM-dependent methyltransferase